MKANDPARTGQDANRHLIFRIPHDGSEPGAARPALRILCAWCRQGARPDDPPEEAAVPLSHGICRACAVRYFRIDPLTPPGDHTPAAACG